MLVVWLSQFPLPKGAGGLGSRKMIQLFQCNIASETFAFEKITNSDCRMIFFCIFATAKRECSSVGRASASQAEGRGFEPRYSLAINDVETCHGASLHHFMHQDKAVPHSGQNLPVTSVPHFGQCFGPSSVGSCVPHSGQNLPVVSVTHFGHFLTALGAGAGVPHSGQNLPVIIVPHFGQGTPCGG